MEHHGGVMGITVDRLGILVKNGKYAFYFFNRLHNYKEREKWKKSLFTKERPKMYSNLKKVITYLSSRTTVQARTESSIPVKTPWDLRLKVSEMLTFV